MQYHRNKTKLKVSTKKGKKYYDCLVRQIKVLKTPEEEIRQLFLYYLIIEKEVPLDCLFVEKTLKGIFNDIEHNGRIDIVIYNDTKTKNSKYTERDIVAVIECKKPKSALIDGYMQLLDYNEHLNACFSVVTNGKEHHIEFYNSPKKRVEV
jgi:Type I restriction enzyme R protein N terminus (HSDR_N)